MAQSRNVNLITSDVVKQFEQMEPRHIALLIAKIQNPDRSLTDLAGDLWPELGLDRKRQIMSQAKIDSVIRLIREKPWVLTTIMAGKLAPIVMATLFELSQTADKDNVRVTAAKELIRLAQSTVHSTMVDDGELEGVEALDEQLANSRSMVPVDVTDDEGPDDDTVLTDEDLME